MEEGGEMGGNEEGEMERRRVGGRNMGGGRGWEEGARGGFIM